MTAPRRRVLRNAVAVDPAQDLRRVLLTEKMTKERAALKRWMSKLRRSFSTVERIQARITRMEKRLGFLNS